MNVTELQECHAVLGDEDFLISGCHVASDLTYFTQFPRRIANEPITVSNVSSKPYFEYYQISSSFSHSIYDRATFVRRREISLVVFSPNRTFDRETWSIEIRLNVSPR